MMHTADNVTCPIARGLEPGNYHFEKRCEDCDARELARAPLGKVEDLYHTGRITQDQYEAYMHVWASLSPSGSRPEWRGEPAGPTARRIARKIRQFV